MPGVTYIKVYFKKQKINKQLAFIERENKLEMKIGTN